jgi:hypothetical protein
LEELDISMEKELAHNFPYKPSVRANKCLHAPLFARLISNLQSIRQLILSGQHTLSDECVEMMRHCPQIEDLNLENCVYLTKV